MNYQEMQKKIADAINAFPMAFAFSNEQLNEALVKLGAADISECVSIGNGGLVHKRYAKKYVEMFKTLDAEMDKLMLNDEFMIEAIRCELGNHEYSYTYDPTDTVDCLDLDLNDERTKRLYIEARDEYLENRGE